MTSGRPPRRGRTVSLAALALGIIVLAGAGFALRERILEAWLIHRLKADEESARRAAAEKLAAMGSRRAVPRLLEIFLAEGQDLSEPHFSREALLRIGPPAVAAILAEVDGLDANRAALVADLLGRFDARAAPALIAGLENAGPKGREIAAAALGSFGPETGSVLVALIKAMDDREFRVRLAAIGSLGRQGERAEAAIPSLFDKLADPEQVGPIRSAAAHSLFRVGTHGQEALLAGLERLDPMGRAICVNLLGQLKPRPEAVEEGIRRALADPDIMVRRSAVSALGGVGPGAAEAIPALREALRDPELADEALQALLIIDRVAAVQAVLDDLAAGEWRLIGSAEGALRAAGPRAAEALPGLTRALAAEDPIVRANACRALRALGPAAATAAPDLAERARADPSEEVRDQARRALEVINPSPPAESRPPGGR